MHFEVFFIAIYFIHINFSFQFGDDVSILIASVPKKSAAEVTEYYFRFIYSAVQNDENKPST